MVRVGGVRLGVDHHHAGAGEGGHDVHVALGAVGAVVAGQAVRQPDRLGGAEVGVDLRLDLLAGPVGVAPGAQLHGVGEEHGALAVDVDRTALVDQRGAVRTGAGEVRDVPGDLGVVLPAGPLLGAPAVEGPVHGGQPAGLVGDEGRADVAHPGVVELPLHQLYVVADDRAGALGVTGRDDQGHGLVRAHRAGDGAPGPAGLGELLLVGEGRVGARPGHPGALVGRPLGGHPETVVRGLCSHGSGP